jgi:hypothetical protein
VAVRPCCTRQCRVCAAVQPVAVDVVAFALWATQVYEKCSSRPHETWLFLNYMGKENLLFLHGKAAKDMRLR